MRVFNTVLLSTILRTLRKEEVHYLTKKVCSLSIAKEMLPLFLSNLTGTDAKLLFEASTEVFGIGKAYHRRDFGYGIPAGQE